MIKYVCRKCHAEFLVPDKDRVRCYSCRKMSLMPVENLPEKKEVASTHFIKAPAEKIFKENKFNDDLTQCLDDRDFTKKVKFSVSEREERKSVFVNKQCSSCNRDFTTKFENEHRCSKCSRG